MTESTEKKELTFEEALAQLQKIIAELEEGDGSLETDLARYEEGMKLITFSTQLLDNAELRVQELLPSGEEVDFDGPLDSRS